MASTAEIDARDTDDSPRTSAGLGALPRWKIGLLIGAGALVLVGLVLLAFEGLGGAGDLSTSQGPQSPEGFPPGATGFDVSGPNQGSASAAEDPTLAPVFLKLGFSFFVGFAIGYAFRAFLKLAMVFVGVLLLTLFLLSYVQWVTVNWETMAGTFDAFVAGVKDDLQAFHSFLAGSLPQAGLASLGLVAGFKR